MIQRMFNPHCRYYVLLTFPCSKVASRPSQPGNSQAAAAAAARAKALEVPRAYQRARMEAGPTTYTVVPKSNVIFNENRQKGGGGGEDILKKIKARRGGGGGR